MPASRGKPLDRIIHEAWASCGCRAGDTRGARRPGADGGPLRVLAHGPAGRKAPEKGARSPGAPGKAGGRSRAAARRCGS